MMFGEFIMFQVDPTSSSVSRFSFSGGGSIRKKCSRVSFLFGVLVVVVAFSASMPVASAQITSTLGAVTEIAPPPSVESGALEDDDELFVFQEQHDYSLPIDATVEIFEPGDYVEANLGLSTIAAGTLVNIFYVTYDRVGTASPHVGLNGTIEFDFPILGIDIAPDATEDSVFGAIGTSYDGRGAINFSHLVQEDFLSLSADQRTLDMFLSVGSAGKDSMRIFTAVTEPTPGDANGDGHIDGTDYLVWAGRYGDDPAADPPGSPGNGDFNNDGVVDGHDYLTWAGSYGQGPNDGVAVPEPGTLGIALLGLVGFLGVTRRLHKGDTSCV
jgi:hypothetical protein